MNLISAFVQVWTLWKLSHLPVNCLTRLFWRQVELKISGASSIKQTIVLDAECPYLKFVTQVSWISLTFIVYLKPYKCYILLKDNHYNGVGCTSSVHSVQ